MGAVLNAIIHIGPPKTATSSLQQSVIPFLGRPYQIKPTWAQSLARGARFTPPAALPQDLIVSHESLGTFNYFPPKTIADRLAQVFAAGTVVFIRRRALDLFYSYYRQRLINQMMMQDKVLAVFGRLDGPITADAFFDAEHRLYARDRRGFFAMVNVNAVKLAFEPMFDLRILDFDLLEQSREAFVTAFTRACGIAASPSLDHANQSGDARLHEAATDAPAFVPEDLRRRFETFYRHARLSPDREEVLLNWERNGTLRAFAAAFSLPRFS